MSAKNSGDGAKAGANQPATAPSNDVEQQGTNDASHMLNHAAAAAAAANHDEEPTTPRVSQKMPAISVHSSDSGRPASKVYVSILLTMSKLC